MRTCTNKKCLEINPQPIAAFGKDSRYADKLAKHCKKCMARKTALYYAQFPEKKKVADKKYILSHAKQKAINDKKYAVNNRLKIRVTRRIWYAKRRESDICFVLGRNLRSRIRSALLGNFKRGSAIRDLGCTIQEFKSHIEKQFVEGMSWDNYGKWQLDHIFPLSKVDLTNREELLKVCHYTNYQPLWQNDNIRKFNHIPQE